jgi:hypothetical protein
MVPCGISVSRQQVLCDGSGLSAEWFLDHIMVTNVTTNAAAKFPCGGWLDAKAGWSRLLVPEGVDSTAAAVAAAAREIEYAVQV